MTKLAWGATGSRKYETGVDRGVLYLQTTTTAYDKAVVWNGLTTVTESPSGAENTDIYADNVVYGSLRSAELFGATIEAYTYPEEFAACDGQASPVAGLTIGQQTRKSFGLAYRTFVGDDVTAAGEGDYKLHLIYGATAAPSEKAYGTVNDSPEAITFSWEVTTTPVSITDQKPSACLVLDSALIGDKMAAIEALLYGTDEAEARLPMPDEIITLLKATP